MSKPVTLREYLAETGTSLAAFGERIGTSAEAVRRYAEGERMARPEIARAIVGETQGRVTLESLTKTYLDHQAAPAHLAHAAAKPIRKAG